MITNKRQILRWAGLLGLAATAVVLAGCSGGDQSAGTSTGTGTQTASSGTGMGGSGMGGSGGGMMGGPMGGSMMGGSGGGMMGMGGAPAAQTASATTAPPPPGSMPTHRPDPFKPWWANVNPPPPVLSFVSPVRIAIRDSAEPQNQPGIDIKEVPNQRVAGILSGNGVYALLDGPEGQTVVKPGDPVGEYTVASINPDSVVLKREVKNGQFKQTYTQVVPLTDQGSNMGSRVSGPGMMGGPGAMGGSGMMGPRGGMFPGMPGGLRGGKGGGGGGAAE